MLRYTVLLLAAIVHLMNADPPYVSSIAGGTWYEDKIACESLGGQLATYHSWSDLEELIASCARATCYTGWYDADADKQFEFVTGETMPNTLEGESVWSDFFGVGVEPHGTPCGGVGAVFDSRKIFDAGCGGNMSPVCENLSHLSECKKQGFEQGIEGGCKCAENCAGKYCQNGAASGVKGDDLCSVQSEVCCCGEGCEEILPDSIQVPPLMVKEPLSHHENGAEINLFKATPTNYTQYFVSVTSSVVMSVIFSLLCVFSVLFCCTRNRGKGKKFMVVDDEQSEA